MYWALLALLIIDVMILYSTAKKEQYHEEEKKADWTVYGTMGCGWTRKQLKYMEDKKISHVFVDCDSGDCGAMNAFPTMVGPDGKKIIGYKEV